MCAKNTDDVEITKRISICVACRASTKSNQRSNLFVLTAKYKHPATYAQSGKQRGRSCDFAVSQIPPTTKTSREAARSPSKTLVATTHEVATLSRVLP